MLNNRTAPSLGLILAFTLLTSCVYYNGDGSWGVFNDDWGNIRGSGYTETEIRPVSGIRSVRLDNQGDLSIELGDTESLVVEADDNLLPYIVTEVRGGELHIYNEGSNRVRNRVPIRYYLTVKSLEGLEIGSAGSINAPDLSADRFEIGISSTGNLVMGDLKAGAVDIDVSSTGDVMMRRLEAASLDVNISSTGHVSIRDGRVSGQKIRISSTGSYEAMDLGSDVAEVRLSSTGSAFILVNDYMEAILNSTGSVHYRGEARTDIRRNSVGRAILVSRR